MLAGCVTTEQKDKFHSSGIASFYWQGQKTASGEKFNPNALTAAHKSLKMGTRIRVTNKSNGKSIIVRINDRGPYTGGRILDLSKEAANQLGFIKNGTAKVDIHIID